MTLNLNAIKDPLTGEKINLRLGVDLQVCHSPGQTPALVFLHGGLGNRFNWRSQYEFFQSQGREVLVYDLAGHGQSQPYNRYSVGRHCRDLTRLLRHFHIQSPILCCHSYGVPIGLEWARRHQVSALVAIAGGTHNLTPRWGRARECSHRKMWLSAPSFSGTCCRPIARDFTPILFNGSYRLKKSRLTEFHH